MDAAVQYQNLDPIDESEHDRKCAHLSGCLVLNCFLVSFKFHSSDFAGTSFFEEEEDEELNQQLEDYYHEQLQEEEFDRQLEDYEQQHVEMPHRSYFYADYTSESVSIQLGEWWWSACLSSLFCVGRLILIATV